MVNFCRLMSLKSLVFVGLMVCLGCGTDSDFNPNTNNFFQTVAGTPTVTKINSVWGPSSGGSRVVITGTNFTDATSVLFGTTRAASFTVDSSTQITATTPAVSTGTVDITVVTAGGTSATSSADLYSFTVDQVGGSWPAGQTQTRVTNINGPINAQQTSFTGYTAGPYNYLLYPFKVPVSGLYTATSSTTTVTNTTWVLNGLFSPSNTAPTTPLSNFIVAVLANNNNPHVGTFTGFNLVAGNQYSILIAFNTGSTTADVGTFTITGPGGEGLISTP